MLKHWEYCNFLQYVTGIAMLQCAVTSINCNQTLPMSNPRSAILKLKFCLIMSNTLNINSIINVIIEIFLLL